MSILNGAITSDMLIKLGPSSVRWLKILRLLSLAEQSVNAQAHMSSITDPSAAGVGLAGGYVGVMTIMYATSAYFDYDDMLNLALFVLFSAVSVPLHAKMAWSNSVGGVYAIGAVCAFHADSHKISIKSRLCRRSPDRRCIHNESELALVSSRAKYCGLTDQIPFRCVSIT